MLVGIHILTLYNARAEPRLYAEVAQQAEELGYDSLWMGHHIALPAVTQSKYPYSASGKPIQEPSQDRWDPWVMFTHLAAATKRLKFGTGVYVLPLVSPLLTARFVASADILSSGRIIFGVGTGWNREEFRFLGQKYEDRGPRTDEILEILQRLWTEDTVEYHGQHFEFDAVNFSPKPAQKPHPPIIYGGAASAALQRAARLDGIYLLTSDRDEISGTLRKLHKLREDYGYAGKPFEVTVQAPRPLTRSALADLADLGVHRVIFDVGTSPAEDTPGPVPLTRAGLTENLLWVADKIGLH